MKLYHNEVIQNTERNSVIDAVDDTDARDPDTRKVVLVRDAVPWRPVGPPNQREAVSPSGYVVDRGIEFCRDIAAETRRERRDYEPVRWVVRLVYEPITESCVV
jgi:hypothetical protein